MTHEKLISVFFLLTLSMVSIALLSPHEKDALSAFEQFKT